MPLLLEQLVYTSFLEVGFKLFTSEQVSLQIQQAFLRQVIYQRWDSYNLKSPRYRAAYLLQISPERCLFGWLYNDGLDELGRSHVPYFICYYLAIPREAFPLEAVCACLQKGPVALIDRHSLSPSLEPIMLSEWHYQPARPGVAIPRNVRKQISAILRQGKLIDLFIPVDERENIIEIKEQTQPQQWVATRENSAYGTSLLPYKNSILLLGINIGVATTLAVTVLIYGFLHMKVLVPNQYLQPTFQNALPQSDTSLQKFRQSLFKLYIW